MKQFKSPVITAFLLIAALVSTSLLPSRGYAVGLPTDNEVTQPEIERGLSYDYPKMFGYARELLTRPEVKKFLKIVFAEELAISEEMQRKFGFPEKLTEMSESQFVLLLQHNPKLWKLLDGYIKDIPEIKDTAKQEELRKEWRAKILEVIESKGVLETFQQFNDPTAPLPLLTPNGEPGYNNLKLFVGHQSIRNGQKIAASNLKQVWLDFINSATKELAINVYDFDLQEVADALIKQAENGVAIRVGIDAGVIETRPEVKAIFKQLKKIKGIEISAVDAVGLNHQKTATKDWSLPSKAGVLFSSGNLTQSCIGPEGDLVAFAERPVFSVPNANHVVTMDSHVVANLVNHELTKTLDMKLRGREYPLGGTFQVFGPKGQGANAPHIIIAFSPRGGLGNINSDLIAQAILKTRGPIRMMQFAFSSETVGDALLQRAQAETIEHHSFDFKSVGDTPFAMREWSIFLEMSGYELQVDGENHKYVDKQDSPWRGVLGEELFQTLRDNIRVAPFNYGRRSWTAPDGTEHEVTSKIHHKFMRTGDVVFVGTSYNFSENALTNNEQILMVVDPEFAVEATEMFDGLNAETRRSVQQTAIKRNSYTNDRDKGIEELQIIPDAATKKLEVLLVGRSRQAAKAKAAAEALKASCEAKLKGQ